MMITKYVYRDIRISLRPQERLQISIVDEKDTPLQVDELYAFSTKHIPAIPPAFTGKSVTGSFTLFVGGEVEDLTLLALKYSSDSSDGYLLVREISVKEDRVITISAKKLLD